MRVKRGRVSTKPSSAFERTVGSSPSRWIPTEGFFEMEGKYGSAISILLPQNSEIGQCGGMPTVKLGYGDLIKRMQNFPNQIPYALARALTFTAQRCQTAIRGEMPARFTLRNEWS